MRILFLNPRKIPDLSLKIEETKDPLWYEKEISDKTMLKLTNVSSQYRHNIKIDGSEETKTAYHFHTCRKRLIETLVMSFHCL